jgi:DNA (cytosine-5)-methyltransferase 1
MMRALDLFSGYAGITLALQDYVKPIAYVEIEPYAQKIIAYRMADRSIPRAPILGDVKNVRGELGICDIIYGGFPCQDISVAGNGKGLAGERSGLFYEIIRLAKEIRPAFVFLENVPAIRTRGLREVVRAFTEIGYDCRWTCISASSVGANHKRERWFLLAHAKSERYLVGRETRDIFKAHGRQNGQVRSEFSSTSEATENMADSTSQISTGLRSEEAAEHAEPRGSSKHIFRSEWWAVEPNVGRVVNGCAFRVDRIKALGNGVVPLQVRTAFELLMGLK